MYTVSLVSKKTEDIAQRNNKGFDMCSNPYQLSQQLRVFLLFKTLETTTTSSLWVRRTTCADKNWDQGVFHVRQHIEYPLFQVCVCVSTFLVFISPSVQPRPDCQLCLFSWKSGWIQFTLLQEVTSSSYSLLLLPAALHPSHGTSLRSCLFLFLFSSLCLLSFLLSPAFSHFIEIEREKQREDALVWALILCIVYSDVQYVQIWPISNTDQ